MASRQHIFWTHYLPVLIAWVILTSLWLCAIPCTAAPQGGTSRSMIPLEDFFRNPKANSFDISPDGQWLALMRPWKNRMNLFIRSTRGGKLHRITSETERDIDRFFWKGNDRLVFFKDVGGDENYHAFLALRKGGEVVDLTPFPKTRAKLVDVWFDSNSEFLVGINNRDPKIFDVFKLNVVTKALTLAAENPGNVINWVVDHQGRVRGGMATEGADVNFIYRKDESVPFKIKLKTSFWDKFDPITFDSSGRLIYAKSNLGRDRSAIVLIDPDTMAEQKVIFEEFKVLGWQAKVAVGPDTGKTLSNLLMGSVLEAEGNLTVTSLVQALLDVRKSPHSATAYRGYEVGAFRD